MRLHAKLEEIHQKLLRNGCFPGLHWVPQNILADEKEKVLCGHSEKSAIACASINVTEDPPMHVTMDTGLWWLHFYHIPYIMIENCRIQGYDYKPCPHFCRW